ncbi:MAG: tetratricopeptide repeat protein [Anaerolineae bacterium]|nr:tetratricopeptide repeat protein [Anaerolineae bacterium]
MTTAVLQRARATTWAGMAAVLLLASASASLSPTAAPHAVAGWGSVALGTLLATAWWFASQGGSRVAATADHLEAAPSLLTRMSLYLLAIAGLSQVAAATVQALATIHLPSPHLPLHNTPAIGPVYLAIGGVLAFTLTRLTLSRGRVGLLWSALLAAGVLSSILYLWAFAVPETGPSGSSILGLALIATALAPVRVALPGPRRTAALWSPAAWALLFLGTLALTAILSPVPGVSLDFWVKLATLLLLAGVLSLSLDAPSSWVHAALLVVLIAGAIPAAMALVKLVVLTGTFDLASALAYRLHPTEFGGANLVARSVICVAPLALALGRTGRAVLRLVGVIGVGAAALVSLYARSWEGVFALLVSLAIYGSLANQQWIAATWWRLQTRRRARWFVVGCMIVLLLSGMAVSLHVARSLNVYSFNGRLIHWYGAVLAWRDHVWMGGGLANDMLYTPYADSVALFFPTQASYDDPLHVIPVNAGRALWSHAHNLLLEIGASGGIFACLSLLGLLLTLLVLGWRALRYHSDEPLFWIAGCLAGLAGALAWGMLDVLRASPPYFAFPVWALIGLLVAAARLPRPVKEESGSQAQSTRDSHPQPWVVSWLLLGLAISLALLPSLGSAHYAGGFLALQEQRWADGVASLDRAARYQPLDPQPHSLLAEAYLARQGVEQATVAYHRSLERKEEFSLYLSRLGWLAWLGSDAEQAAEYFDRAIARDPAEIARWGLHADLGLAYAAQGTHDRAIDLFKQGVERNPELVLSPYWVPLPGSTTVDLALDPVYLHGPSPELGKRILAHLGAADYTTRIFAPTDVLSSPISLTAVLDAVEADYRQAVAQDSRQAPLLLAALAEASRLVGLDARAEHAYLEFQALQPDSAYGFRDLGVLYHDQGRLEEAQAALEHAVEVSPRDVDSRYRLALVYMDRELWDEAEQALATIISQSLTTLFHSRLFDPDLYVASERIRLAKGDVEGAIEARARAAAIRDLPEDHLALAGLYRQVGEESHATDECAAAARALFRTWPRPLDPLLWEIGTCLVQAPDGEIPREISRLARAHPLPGNVLLGHFYRSRGELDAALGAYEAAAAARPDEGAPHYFLGETYQALGRPDAAEREYLLAAELDPLESLPLLALGRMQWSQGRHEEAVETFRAAVDATPGWGQAHVALGNALGAVGDPAGAARHYELAALADRSLSEGVRYDFAAQLGDATVEAPGAEYVRNDYFQIGGDERRTLFMHPDARARYTVQVPGGATLQFDIATSPGSWDQPGDGVTFAIYVESVAGMEGLFSAYIDPKHDPDARRWHPGTVDLGAYSGQEVTLVFETSSGPEGDVQYDWAGWGLPRLTAH